MKTKTPYALCLIALCLFFTFHSFSQGVAINVSGADANASALLEIGGATGPSGDTQGLLIPRVALTATNSALPIASPATSLLVYNTATAGTAPNNVTPGYYYWAASAWVKLATAPGPTGVDGTTGATGPTGAAGPSGTNTGDMLYWNGAAWVIVPVGQPGQFLQFTTSNIPAWSGFIYPTLTTTDASAITSNSATSGGNITSDGGATVTARGVCWSTLTNPTIANNITSDGTGIGSFSSSITGLTPSATYYVRAYATACVVGTVYGNEVHFTTLPATFATLTTTAISSTTSSTATSGGNITNDGGATVIARGVCWNTSTNPTITNSHTSDNTGIGSFTSSITGLTGGVTYYVKAYATNSVGTAYGNEINFIAIGIGDNYLGGKVAYILQSGDNGYSASITHGLIAASSDQGTAIAWSNITSPSVGSTAEGIGAGMANTTTIVGQSGCTSGAAYICKHPFTGDGGYTDWFLPSKFELVKLSENRVAIGGFVDAYYWSSTEYSSTIPWDVYFGYVASNNDHVKSLQLHVRCARAF
ncbi:MAG: DUF1566 domain-containing protein [Bacteroidetes bacterium]|nr:DUF1566 domain-containing protein [Bacteroidota bacterium]